MITVLKQTFSYQDNVLPRRHRAKLKKQVKNHDVVVLNVRFLFIAQFFQVILTC